jgi:hypothetical protein
MKKVRFLYSRLSRKPTTSSHSQKRSRRRASMPQHCSTGGESCGGKASQGQGHPEQPHLLTKQFCLACDVVGQRQSPVTNCHVTSTVTVFQNPNLTAVSALSSSIHNGSTTITITNHIRCACIKIFLDPYMPCTAYWSFAKRRWRISLVCTKKSNMRELDYLKPRTPKGAYGTTSCCTTIILGHSMHRMSPYGTKPYL